jgi:hypothetical protein
MDHTNGPLSRRYLINFYPIEATGSESEPARTLAQRGERGGGIVFTGPGKPTK